MPKKYQDILIATILAILWSLFVYGCISFYNWNPDPETWHEGGRFAMTFFGFVVGAGIGVGFYKINQLDNE